MPVKETVFFSLGSNLGDRARNLEAALDQLSRFVSDLAASRVYETDPLHRRNQGRFLNLAARGVVATEPHVLLTRIHEIERRLGRRRRVQFGPRTIDIDILLFGRRQVEGRGLIIPHPRLTERRFALVPLLELASGLTAPGDGTLYWKCLDRCGPGGVYFHSFSRYTERSLYALAGAGKIETK